MSKLTVKSNRLYTVHLKSELWIDAVLPSWPLLVIHLFLQPKEFVADFSDWINGANSSFATTEERGHVHQKRDSIAAC